jgi:LysM repeat protein
VTNVVSSERAWTQVRLVDGYQTGGVALEVTFDPRYIRVEDSVPDAAGVQIRVDTLCDAPLNVIQDVIVNEVDNEAGIIRFESAWSLSAYLCADALVASIDVRGVTEGGCPLRFERADVAGLDGELAEVERPGNALVLVAMAEGTPRPVDEQRPTSEVPSEAQPPGEVYHTVRDGETLLKIALEYGTTVEAISEANGLDDPDSVSIGQRLLIPMVGGAGEVPPANTEQPPDDVTEYVVQSGDTLSSIAQRFGTTVEALAELNGLDPPYVIAAGETLRIR